MDGIKEKQLVWCGHGRAETTKEEVQMESLWQVDKRQTLEDLVEWNINKENL